MKININYLNSRPYHVLIIGYLIFIFIVIIFSADIFGPVRAFTNKSESMNPAIDRGSITVVRSFNVYEVGDAVSYYDQVEDGEEIITHRITGIGGNVYTTKGDANEVADRELVKERLIIGKVILVIPYLGHVITFAKGLVGMWLTIILPAMFIVGSELIRIMMVLDQSKEIE